MVGMMSSVARPSFLAFIVGCCLFLLQCSYVSASVNWKGDPMGSRNCVRRIASTRDKSSDGCVQPVCGALNTTGEPFEKSLTPSCDAVLQKYRAKNLSSSWATLQTPEEGCRTLRGSEYPGNPVVVQTKVTGSFGFCSVTKAADAEVRSLLFVMTRYPEPINWVGEMWRVNMQRYPSLYHFDTPKSIPTSFPTFVLGRNPYSRLLSAFLDKMANERSKDMSILRKVNEATGRVQTVFYKPNRDGFREFITELTPVVKAGKPLNDGHFEPMVKVCNAREVPYHYFLRQEEMAQWLPCLRDALRLNQFTDMGWDHSRQERSDWYTPKHKGCWWTPKGMTCIDYMNQSRELVQGQRASIDVPETNRNSGDEWNDGGDEWNLFYDQEMADMVYEAYKIDFEAFGYDRLVLDV